MLGAGFGFQDVSILTNIDRETPNEQAAKPGNHPPEVHIPVQRHGTILY